jgi:hypothetical protein
MLSSVVPFLHPLFIHLFLFLFGGRFPVPFFSAGFAVPCIFPFSTHSTLSTLRVLIFLPVGFPPPPLGFASRSLGFYGPFGGLLLLLPLASVTLLFLAFVRFLFRLCFDLVFRARVSLLYLFFSYFSLAVMFASCVRLSSGCLCGSERCGNGRHVRECGRRRYSISAKGIIYAGVFP